MDDKGKLIVICAPSGTGKSTLLKRLKSEMPFLKWSVSCTTRPQREGEVEGKDYHFLSVKAFEGKLESDDFVEWAKVHSNYYGTSKEFIHEGLSRGDALLFDLDVQGADSMKKIYSSKAKVIFIEPPSVDELEKRLKSRATDSLAVIEERIRNAKKELTRKNDFDYLVMNDDVNKAYQDLCKVIKEILG